MTAMDFFLNPTVHPFVVAGLIVLALVGIEAIALLMGLSSWHLMDHHTGVGDLHSGEVGLLASAFGWLNVGRIPLMALLVLLLATFSVVGFAVQSIALHIGGQLPVWIVSAGAAGAALPVARVGSRFVAKIVPRDETYAVIDQDFIGRTAIVTVGPVQSEGVARAKVRDDHGNWHFPRVKSAQTDDVFQIGETVLIVDRKGREFLVVSAEKSFKDSVPHA